MNLRKRQLQKIAAAIVLIALSAIVATFIHDTLSLQVIESSLPELSVMFENEQILPEKHIRRDSYTWKNFFWPSQSGGGLDLEVWREIEPAWVPPGTELQLNFTFDPQHVQVEVAAGESEFVDQGNNLLAPTTPGVYTYRVSASWGDERIVQYYFRVRIPVW